MRIIVKCILAFLVVSMCSCHLNDLEVDKIKSVELSPTLGIKIGTTTYTVKEIIDDLEDESLTVDESDDLLISLVYRQTSEFSSVDELVEVTTVSNSEEYRVPTSIPATPVEQTIPFSTIFDFEFEASDGARLDSVVFSGGTLDYSMYSTFPTDIVYDWTITNLKSTSGGADLTQSNTLVYQGAELSDSYSEDLTGYRFAIRSEDGLNKFDVVLNGDLVLGAGVELTTSQGMFFDLGFIDPEFSALFGYFGNEPIEIEESEISIGVIDEYDTDGLVFTDPSLTLEIVNSYGIEMLLDISGLTAILSDGSEIPLENDLSDGERLVLSPEAVGQSRTSTIQLNSDNSNIAEMLEHIPDKLVFDINVTPNPDVSTLENNFLTDSSYVEANVTMELPMILRLNEFSNDFEIDLEDDTDLSVANSVTLIAAISNQMPFSGAIELELLDENGEVFYTIPGDLNFDSPEVGTDGRTIAPQLTEASLLIDSTSFSEIENASQMRAKTTFSSYESESGESVKIFSDYELTIDFSLIADLTVEL